MIKNIQCLFNIIILSTFLTTCKGQKDENYLHENNNRSSLDVKKESSEIYLGKIFFVGDEMNQYQFIKGDKTIVDSISYSIYQNIDNKKYVFSLEKLLRNDDIEKYQIIDTINLQKNVLVDKLNLIRQKSNDGISLVYNKKKLKSWKFNLNKINIDLWQGNYTINIDYGKLDEFSEMSIEYDISINNSKCTFSGQGYKTFFVDECTIKNNNTNLILKYKKTIDGDGFSDHSTLDTLAIIISKNNKYYIKSPIVADKNWNYNTELLFDKKDN